MADLENEDLNPAEEGVELKTAEESFNKAKSIEEGREEVAKKIDAATAKGKYDTFAFPAAEVITELRAKGYDVDDMTNFGKIQGYKISWKDGLVDNIGTFEEGTNTFEDENKKLVLSGTVPAQASVTAKGKSVKMQGLKTEASVLKATAAEEVTINGGTVAGAYNKGTQGNAMVVITADEAVEIKNTTFSATGYNGIEIGLANNNVKKVTIANCDFSGKCTNNAISIHSTGDNCVVNIENCHFAEVSNVLRLSNKTNTRCTINVKNCTVDKWATGDYAGFLICQDFTTDGAKNLFGDGKIKINFFNLTTPNGVLKNKMAEDICGTGDENQVVYVYVDHVGLIDYDPKKFPVVKVY